MGSMLIDRHRRTGYRDRVKPMMTTAPAKASAAPEKPRKSNRGGAHSLGSSIDALLVEDSTVSCSGDDRLRRLRARRWRTNPWGTS